jgi:hypothetical protein
LFVSTTKRPKNRPAMEQKRPVSMRISLLNKARAADSTQARFHTQALGGGREGGGGEIENRGIHSMFYVSEEMSVFQ